MKLFDEIIEEIRPGLQELEDQRLHVVEKRKKSIYTILLIAGATLLMLLLFRHPLVLAIGFIGGFIAYSQIYGKIYKRFKHTVKDKLIAKMVSSMGIDLIYNRSSFVSSQDFRKSGIFQKSIDRYWGEDLFKGKIGETELLFSEITAQYKERTTDSKGNSRVRYVTFFDGIFMIADFHKHFKGETIVLPDQAERFLGFVGKSFQKLNFTRGELVYLENPEFEKHFVVYGSDQIEARYILSPGMLERILRLREKFSSSLALSFIDSKVFLAIPRKEDFLEYPLNESFLEGDSVRSAYNEIASILEIVEDLNLNTRIWNK